MKLKNVVRGKFYKVKSDAEIHEICQELYNENKDKVEYKGAVAFQSLEQFIDDYYDGIFNFANRTVQVIAIDNSESMEFWDELKILNEELDECLWISSRFLKRIKKDLTFIAWCDMIVV